MSRVYERLKDYMNWGIGVTVGLAFALLARQELEDLWKQDPWAGAGSTLLLVVTVLRFFLYLRAVRDELDTLNEVFDSNRIQRTEGPVFAVIVGLSFLFAGLIATVTRPLFYTSLAVGFAVFDLQGQAVVNRNVGLYALAGRWRTTASEGKRAAIVRYYFDRPLLLRAAILLVLACAATGLAVAWGVTQEAVFLYLTYGLLIVTTAVGEVIIHRWRTERDLEMEKASAVRTARKPRATKSPRERD